jgi:hypothetical protein
VPSHCGQNAEFHVKARDLKAVTTVLQKIKGVNTLSRTNCLYDEATFGKFVNSDFSFK